MYYIYQLYVTHLQFASNACIYFIQYTNVMFPCVLQTLIFIICLKEMFINVYMRLLDDIIIKFI